MALHRFRGAAFQAVDALRQGLSAAARARRGRILVHPFDHVVGHEAGLGEPAASRKGLAPRDRLEPAGEIGFRDQEVQLAIGDLGGFLDHILGSVEITADRPAVRKKHGQVRTEDPFECPWVPALRRLEKPCLLVGHEIKLGVTVDFPRPQSIGADRLANAAAVADSVKEIPIITISDDNDAAMEVSAENVDDINSVKKPVDDNAVVAETTDDGVTESTAEAESAAPATGETEEAAAAVVVNPDSSITDKALTDTRKTEVYKFKLPNILSHSLTHSHLSLYSHPITCFTAWIIFCSYFALFSEKKKSFLSVF